MNLPKPWPQSVLLQWRYLRKVWIRQLGLDGAYRAHLAFSNYTHKINFLGFTSIMNFDLLEEWYEGSEMAQAFPNVHESVRETKNRGEDLFPGR